MSYPPYPSYQNSEIKWLGDIPDHWSVTALKRNFKIFGGSTPDPDPKNWEGKICWYTPADLSGLETFQLGESKRTISKYGLFSSGCALLPEDSIVVSTRAPIGSLGITMTSGCTNQGCKGLVPSSHISPVYYAYLLVLGKAELNSRGRGSTFTEISGEELGVIRVPVPPHVEQTQIACFLDHQTARIDALIAEQQRLIELLKEKRQSMISHAVTKGLDPDVAMKDSGVKWLGEVPEHWNILKLGYIATDKCDGPFGSAIKSEHYTDSGVRVIRLQNIRRTHFSGKDTAYLDLDYFQRNIGKSEVKEGDVLIAGLGDENNPVGRACVAPPSIEPAMVKADCFRVRLDTNKAAPEFIAFQLSSGALFDGGTLATGSTRSRIPLLTMAARIVALPPLQEQSKIIHEVRNLESGIDQLLVKTQYSLDLLLERRSAIISAAVTGKIDVRDWQPPTSETFPEYRTSEGVTA